MAALPFRAKIGMVCGNIALTNTDLTVGNSTINTFSNSVLIKVANSTLSMNLGLAHYGLSVGTSVVNSTVLSTGGVTVLTTGVAPQNNTTGVDLGSTTQRWNMNANQVYVSNGVYPGSNTLGTALGSTTNRWVLNANTGNFSGNITGPSGGTWNGSGIYPASNSAGQYLGSASSQWIIEANSITTQTLLAATSANVGANVQVTTSTITLGSGSGTAAPLISVANSTANVKIYPTAIQPGANAQAYAIGSTTQRVLVYANTISMSGQITATNNTIETSGIFPITNTNGAELGSGTRRFNLTGNAISLSSTITASGNVTTTGNVNGAIGYFTGLVNAANFTTTGNANAGSHYAISGGMYPTSNSAGEILGTSTAQWKISANTIVCYNYIYPSSNTVGTSLGSSTARWGIYANSVNFSQGAYPASNTLGTALGSTTQRWVLNANTGDFSGLLTSAGLTSTSHVNTSTYFYAGANVYSNTTTVRVGNSTVNTEVGNNIVYVGNTTANAHINSTGFFVGGSTITPTATTSAAGIIELATAAEYRANSATRALEVTEIWGSAANVTLTDAATIAVDMSTGYNFTVTLGASRTLGAPTNTKQGQTGWIHILNPSSYTLGYNAVWKFAGGTDPTLGTTSNNVLYYAVVNSTFIAASLSANVS